MCTILSSFDVGLCRCGGALISADHVLTAARCVEGQSPSSVEVLLGQHSVTFKWMNSVTRLGVSTITSDPLYNISNGQNDLAILTLAQKATFSTKVAPICLPWSCGGHSDDYAGQVATVTGWGLSYYNSTDAERPDVLQEVDINVSSNEECQEAFKNYTAQGKIGE